MFKKKLRFFAAASAAVFAVAAVMFLAGCGKEIYNAEELKNEAARLISDSFEINEICFGKGLPADLSDTEHGGTYVVGSTVYAPVDESSPYHSVTELKEKILSVYSSGYSSALFGTLFEGLSVSSESEDEEGIRQNVEYARYIDGVNGLEALLVNPENILPLDRTYDTDNITVLSQKKGRVELSVPSYVSGEYDRDVMLTIVLEESGWRLDTPTY